MYSASGFTTRSDIGPAREGPSAEVIAYVLLPLSSSFAIYSLITATFFFSYEILLYLSPLFLIRNSHSASEAQARRGEEAEVDPDQFQDPDNEYGLFAGTTYEADDEEADKIYDQVDQNMDARRRARRSVSLPSLTPYLLHPILTCSVWFLWVDREAREEAELAKHRAERPKIQQQFADLKRGLAVVTDAEWESIPEVGNLTRKKRKRNNDERSFVVPDSVMVGDRSKTEYENSLDPMQQEVRFPPPSSLLSVV